jgi:RNase P subunit RPR2
MTAYCMKCKQEREIKNSEKVKMSNGRNAVKGICSTCGTKMFKFVK